MKLWWRLSMLSIAGAAVAAAVWADVRAPASRTVGVIPVPGQAALPRPEVAPATDGTPIGRSWRMVLRLDSELRQPGPEWALREGMSPGLGYELAWLPATLSLQLSRGGDQPLLLGNVRLKRPPREVALARRGARLAVTVDGRNVLDALDPEGVPEPLGPRPFPDGWAVVTPSALGGSTFAVYDDSRLPTSYASDLAPGDNLELTSAILLGPEGADERRRGGIGVPVPGSLGWRPAAQPGRPDHALLCVRRALSMRADRDLAGTLAAIGIAGRAVGALGQRHPDHARLALWLAWAETRNALATAPDQGADQVRPVIDQLIVTVLASGAPEGPGMLLALLSPIAERAVRRPSEPRALAAVLDGRAGWLSILDTTAQAAADMLPAGSSDGLRHSLRFISHACGGLGGNGISTLPLPVDAPEWLAARWRTIAGGMPPEGGMPPAPISQVARIPVLAVGELLVRSAILEPLAAVRLRASLTDATPEELQRRYDAAGLREANLTRVLVAIDALDTTVRSGGPRRNASADQDAAIDQLRRAIDTLGDIGERRVASTPGDLVRRDPLVFSLACLGTSRIQRLTLSAGEGLARVPWRAPLAGTGDFVRLAPFAQLLSGDADATELIWLNDESVLPPTQALAAALAMREVREVERQRLAAREPSTAVADWSALVRLRCFTLPLELLDPATRGTRLEPGTVPSDSAHGP